MKSTTLFILSFLAAQFSFASELTWDLKTYKNISGTGDNPQNIPSVSLQDFISRFQSSRNDHFCIDGNNKIYVARVSVDTRNFDDGIFHPFSRFLLAGKIKDEYLERIYNVQNRKTPENDPEIPYKTSINGYIFYKKGVKGTCMRIDLPCISKTGAKVTPHDELARCLRTSAMHTFLSGNLCLLLDSFSRPKLPTSFDPLCGAFDLLSAAYILKKADPHLTLSSFGTSWGGIAVHMAHVLPLAQDLWHLIDDIHAGSKGFENPFIHYATINYIPLYQYEGEDHIKAPFLNIHGSDDDMLPSFAACQYANAKAAEGKSFKTVLVPGHKHNFFMFDDWEGAKMNLAFPLYEEILMQFKEQLFVEERGQRCIEEYMLMSKCSAAEKTIEILIKSIALYENQAKKDVNDIKRDVGTINGKLMALKSEINHDSWSSEPTKEIKEERSVAKEDQSGVKKKPTILDEIRSIVQ